MAQRSCHDECCECEADGICDDFEGKTVEITSTRKIKNGMELCFKRTLNLTVDKDVRLQFNHLILLRCLVVVQVLLNAAIIGKLD